MPPTHSTRPGRCSPQSLLPAPQVVLHYDASHCAALAHAGPVPNQKTSTLPTGKQDLVLLWVSMNRDGSGLCAWHPPYELGQVGRGDRASYLAGIGDGFQL